MPDDAPDRVVLERLLYKIPQCIDYQNLYAMEDEFNKVGLSVHTTPKNRMILCRVVDGRIVADKVIDDYIFIGSIEDSMRELSERAIYKICNFVRSRADKASKPLNIARPWRNGLRMKDTIMVANEDVSQIADDLDSGLLLG